MIVICAVLVIIIFIIAYFNKYSGSKDILKYTLTNVIKYRHSNLTSNVHYLFCNKRKTLSIK